MTPRRVDPDVVRAKLDLIERTGDVLASLGDVTAERLRAEPITAAAVEAGLIDRDLAERLKPSVGMRNVIIHEYVRLDLELVAASVPEAVDGYRAFVRDVARSLTASA